MAKISYANLKLKVDNSVSTFNFNNNKIEVLNYLPIESKYDLIMITLQKAEENGIYNPLKIDMYFHLNLVYLYTNLSFTDKQKEDEGKIYDTLKSNGFIDEFLEAMNEDEYNDLYQLLEDLKSELLYYNTTTAALVKTIINDLPENAAAAAEIVENFDKAKFAEVVNFAAAINGGKPVV